MLIAAIDRFEEVLKRAREGTLPVGPAFDEAEAELRRRLIELNADDHDVVCEACAEGCTEGVSYRGTVYAAGYGDSGRPVVLVMRRVTRVDVTGRRGVTPGRDAAPRRRWAVRP